MNSIEIMFGPPVEFGASINFCYTELIRASSTDVPVGSPASRTTPDRARAQVPSPSLETPLAVEFTRELLAA